MAPGSRSGHQRSLRRGGYFLSFSFLSSLTSFRSCFRSFTSARRSRRSLRISRVSLLTSCLSLRMLTNLVSRSFLDFEFVIDAGTEGAIVRR